MTPPKKTTTISMDEDDFRLLVLSAYAWEGHGWEKFDDRFVTLPYHDQVEVSFDWHYCYFIGTWAEVILARSFLEACGEPYQTLSDEYDCGAFALVTNYYYGPGEDTFLRRKAAQQ